jgi:hypothetical protein
MPWLLAQIGLPMAGALLVLGVLAALDARWIRRYGRAWRR